MIIISGISLKISKYMHMIIIDSIYYIEVTQGSMPHARSYIGAEQGGKMAEMPPLGMRSFVRYMFHELRKF